MENIPGSFVPQWVAFFHLFYLFYIRIGAEVNIQADTLLNMPMISLLKQGDTEHGPSLGVLIYKDYTHDDIIL